MTKMDFYKIEDITNKILCGDCLTELKKIPSESVDMVISSPPYYALRNYGVDGQIGLEKTFNEYKTKILEITAELKRVLKKSGQLWWNMGDIYGGSNGAGSDQSNPGKQTAPIPKRLTYWGGNVEKSGLTNPERQQFMGRAGNQKCLLMMPERIALEMIDKQGWILRNKIKWAKQVLIKKENRTKGSVMPTSVKDRFNESGEELYFFVKSKKYYSDLDAVRLKTENNYEDFNRRVRDSQKGIGPQFKASGEEIENYGKKSLEARMADTKNKNQKSSRTYNIKKLLSEVRLGIKPNTGMEPNKVNDPRGNHEGGPGSWRDFKEQNPNDGNEFNPLGKNLPSVWLVGSEPHNFQKECDAECDHFATFPQALLEIPIKFGCPKGGIILDPFMGAGTTAIMAKKLGRNYIGIEISEAYCQLAKKRLDKECPPMLF